MTSPIEPRKTRLELSEAFDAADAAWFAELERRFGNDACNARYERRGMGTSEDDLGRLFLARDKARMAWEAAR